jgi:3D (Asp-Asp-Asp) domain-containing protein
MNIRYLKLLAVMVPLFLLVQVCSFYARLGTVKQPEQANIAANTDERGNISGSLYPIPEAVTGQVGVSKEAVRTVTAYTVGDLKQTDSKPCIGAGGDNLCSLVKKGIKVCAANFVPLRSKLYVDKIGECIVLDRINARFGGRVDFAMDKEQYHRAVKFGVQRLGVKESEGQRKEN